jgi:hypothetical protein
MCGPGREAPVAIANNLRGLPDEGKTAAIKMMAYLHPRQPFYR